MWSHICVRIFAQEEHPVVGVTSQYNFPSPPSFTSRISTTYLIALLPRVFSNHIIAFTWISMHELIYNIPERPNHSANAVGHDA